jgi:hypothetical protein
MLQPIFTALVAFETHLEDFLALYAFKFSLLPDRTIFSTLA